MDQQYELGFLGAGNMAEAIARAAIDKAVLKPEQMIAADPNKLRRSVISQIGIATNSDNAKVIGRSKQVLIAVKPQVMGQAAADLARYGTDSQVILSIMAGVSTQKLTRAITDQGADKPPRVVRIMPNTPLQVGYGMAAVALGEQASPGDEALAMRLFGAAGKVILLDESKLDAITALSGSGPAYVFYLAQAMQRAASELGLADHGNILVRQTILGAAQLLAASEESPEQLRRKVTSPGGTTEAAINYLDKNNTEKIVVDAIKAAKQRSIELGT